MTKKEIIKNNKLIAEFMGRSGKHNKSLYTFKGVSQILINNDYWYSLSVSKFHSSWDWLMPVVEKIESLGMLIEICINTNSTEIRQLQYCNGAKWHTIAHPKRYTQDATRLTVTYQAIVIFIEWYNQNK